MSTLDVWIDALVLEPTMGGALRYALELLPRAARVGQPEGVQVHLLLAERADWPKVWLERWRAAGIQLVVSNRPMHPAWRRSLNEPSAVKAALLRAGGAPCVLQTQSLPAVRRQGVAHVHLCHGTRRLHTGPLWQRALAKRALRHALHRADAVLAVSETLACELRQLAPKTPLSVVSPGSDHLVANPTSLRGSRWLWLGPDVPHKNLAVLLKLLKSAPELGPFDLCGVDPAKHRALAGLGPRVQLLPAVQPKALQASLEQCAGVLLPSRLESFGMVVLEAMAQGTPLVLSNLPAHREVLGDAADCAFWFEPDDVQGLAQALRAAQQAHATDRIARFKARASSFAWQTSAERTVQVWQQAAARLRS